MIFLPLVVVPLISGYLLFSDISYSKRQNMEYKHYLSMQKLNWIQNKNSSHSKQTLICWIGWIYENSYFNFPDRLCLKVPLKILNSSPAQLCAGLPIIVSYCSPCDWCVPALSLLRCISGGTKECFSSKDYLSCTLQVSFFDSPEMFVWNVTLNVHCAIVKRSDQICSCCKPTYHHCHQPAAHRVKTCSATFRLTFKLFSFKLFLRVAWDPYLFFAVEMATG